MLPIVGTVRLPADKLDAARPVMRRMVEASRAEPGCLDYGYAEDVLDPGLIHVKELWTDQGRLIDTLPRCTSPNGGRRGLYWGSVSGGWSFTRWANRA
ncbi:hypothetical protein GCM10020258_31880 [Sphingomonas yabuuchiae]